MSTWRREGNCTVSVSAIPQHLPMLDGIRGLAILMVLVHNLAILDQPSGKLGRTIEGISDLGWIGVTLFFALSGFLITRTLLATQTSSQYFRNFFARRILRIFPLYYATLICLFILLPASVRAPEIFSGTLISDQSRGVSLWLFLSNWTDPFRPASHPLPHFWSLAVEEQFYLIWPWIVHRRQPAQVLRLCLVLASASFLFRVALLGAQINPEAVYMFTFARMDALALGAAVAAITAMPGLIDRVTAVRGHLLLSAAGLWIAGWVLTHGYPRVLPSGQTLGYSLLALTFAVVILVAVCSESGGTPKVMLALRAPPLRALGKYSYGMYVLHKPLHDLLGKPLLLSLGYEPTRSIAAGVSYLVVGILVTFVAALLSFHLFERPFLNLKRHFGQAPVSKNGAEAPGRVPS